MTRLLSLRNRQRVRAVDTALLRRLALQLLREDFRVSHYELAVHLVAAPEMARLNETYLRHDGSTDVITFNYSDQEFRVPGSGDPKYPFSVGQASCLPVHGASLPRVLLDRRPGRQDAARTGRLEACPTLNTSDPKAKTRNPEPGTPRLHGEIFICLDDAVAQARQFGTSWQSELVRYLVHGLLHLQGFDDGQAASRKKMKREENRLLRSLARRFPLSKLGRGNPRRVTAASAT